MKLIIQVPCLNEELSLPAVLHDLPKQIPGVDVKKRRLLMMVLRMAPWR